MNPRIFTRKSAMPIIMILAMFLLILASITITLTSAEVTELNVPPEVVQGETLSISGKAAPNETVWIGSSFEIALPVSEGQYSRDFTGIHFPEGEKNFSVFAEKIKDIEVSLSPVNEETVTITCFEQTMTITVLGSMITYPLDEPINETDAVEFSVSLPKSIEPFPPLDIIGKKDIAISGDAADDATSVNLGVTMSIKVIADAKGDFELDISTEGVPRGEFLITAGGKEKTVEVVEESTEPTPTPSPSPTPTPSPCPTPTPSPGPTSTPTPSLSPTPTPASTPSPTITLQPTPIKNETTPPSKTNQPPPRETTKPFLIPGFKAIGCIAAVIIIIAMRRGREKKKSS